MVGSSRSGISLLSRKEGSEDKFGSRYWRSVELEDDPNVPRAAFVSEEAIGVLEDALIGGFVFLGSAIAMTAMPTPSSTLAALTASVAIGDAPGAAIGAILAGRACQHNKDYCETLVRQGGILLWVRVSDDEKRPCQ